ncbi:MAG: hypothetical protein Tsb007_37610 [Rhizobacter sp.]
MNCNPLEVPTPVWKALIEDLCKRGFGKRESGAFLLGTMDGDVRRVQAWVPYDELDANALTAGYVRLDTSAFTRLWAICAEKGLTVVADVHTHPVGTTQSRSDRANPMISQAGHFALIVPKFARGRVVPHDVSVNVYLGSKQWASYFKRDAQELIRLI